MSKQINKLLTIVLASYNHEKYIEDCLKSIIKVNLPKNIIIIDDNSTDKSIKIIKSFINKNKHESWKLIEKKENKGLIHSLNIGLQNTKTEYVYFIGSDDVLNPTGIEYAINFLLKNPSIDIFIGGGENLFPNNKKTNIYKKCHLEFFKMPFEERYEALFLRYPSPLLIQSTIFKTNILKAVGGWDNSIPLDDYQIFIKLLGCKNVKFVFKPNIKMVLYRHHDSNSYKDLKKQFLKIKLTLEKMAPYKFRDKAIAKYFSYYFFKSLLKGNFKMAYDLFFLVNYKIWIKALGELFFYIYRKFTYRN